MLTKKDFYKRTCRICGTTNGICVDVMDDSRGDYLHKIHTLLSIKINSDNGLPTRVCEVCISTINDFHSLSEKCDKIQQKLLNIAEVFKSSKSKNTIPTIENGSPNGSPPNELKVNERTNATVITTEESSKDVSSAVEDSSPTDAGWTIRKIHGNNTMLFVCNKCKAILLCESAMKTHKCATETQTASLDKAIPSLANSDFPDSAKKKKRKRILFEGDDDNEETSN